jgi:GWxTD domain-containing protein
MNRASTALVLLLAAPALLSPSAPSEAGEVEYEIRGEDVLPLAREMRLQIAGLQYFLNPYQLKQFFSLPDDGARRDWIARYWRAHDPTPTTGKNEKMIEHNIRVKLARQFFASEKWPYWDKRGEVYIRYGPPNYRGIVHAEVTARKVHPPGELWYYTRHDMVVSFQDFNLNGHYIYAINPFGALQDMDPELVEFLAFAADEPLERSIPSDLLDSYRDPETDPEVDRSPWSPLEEAAIGPKPVRVVRERMNRVVEGMDEIANPDQAAITPDNPSDQFLLRRADEMAANFEGVLEDTPASYPFNFQEEERLPFFFGVEQFKAGEAVNRVEVNVQFPVDPLREGEDRAARTYRAAAVFLDKDYNRVARDDRELVLPVRAGDGATTRYVPAQLIGSLERSYYRVAVSVTEVETQRTSSYWTTVELEDYGGELALSDVLFAQKIESAERQSPFNRGALEVVPHPLRRYPRGSTVPVYFEVYNLGLDEDGLANYTVEYRIVPHEGQKKRFWDRFDGPTPAASSRFKSSGYSADEPLFVKIESENLAPGAYDFLVTVKDEYWQSVAYRRATFRIVE